MNDSAVVSAEQTTSNEVLNLVPGIIIESALFGILTLLVLASAIILCRQGIEFGPRLFMLSAIICMYIASGTHSFADIYTSMRILQALPEPGYFWALVDTVALFFDFWISDMVVMWRACVFWGWARHVQIPFIIFIGLPVILGIIDVSTSPPTPTENTFEPDLFGFAALMISLLSNIWATSLIGYKAWVHRKEIRERLGDESRTTAAQSILVLLTESGFLYCVIWAIFIFSTIYSEKYSTHVTHAVSCTLPPIVGLYPTTIILLVSFKKSYLDQNISYGGGPPVMTTVLSTMVAAVPQTQSMSGSVPGFHQRVVSGPYQPEHDSPNPNTSDHCYMSSKMEQNMHSLV